MVHTWSSKYTTLVPKHSAWIRITRWQGLNKFPWPQSFWLCICVVGGRWIIISISDNPQDDTADAVLGTQSWQPVIQRALRTLKNFVLSLGVSRKRTVSYYSFRSVGSFFLSHPPIASLAWLCMGLEPYAMFCGELQWDLKKFVFAFGKWAIYNRIQARNKWQRYERYIKNCIHTTVWLYRIKYKEIREKTKKGVDLGFLVIRFKSARCVEKHGVGHMGQNMESQRKDAKFVAEIFSDDCLLELECHYYKFEDFSDHKYLW